MLTERDRRNGNYSLFGSDHVTDLIDNSLAMPSSSPSSSKQFPYLDSSSSSSSSSSFASGSGGGRGRGRGPGVNYIEHTVSKMDTLAGVAIKYGVEVADIKRMNGLVTDLQMFALKTLQIPLPGRHPPSPYLSNGSQTLGHAHSSSDQTPPHRVHRDLFESFQSLSVTPSQRKVSPAMSSLQGYYGLKPSDKKPEHEGLVMAVYSKGSAHYLDDGPFPIDLPGSNPPLSRHRKSRSVANGFMTENGELPDDMPIAESREADSDKWNENLFGRRQKSEADFLSRTPEMLLKEDNNSSSGGFSAIMGKGLALRPKAASRTSLAADGEVSGLNTTPIGLGDSFLIDTSGVKKSSSTSSLQDQDNAGSSSIWPTSKWSLKPDLQALSAAAIRRPIFDGLPKPITGRKNKAALD